MTSFGQTTVDTIGASVQVSADGSPEMKSGGVSIDWTSVVAISGSDVTYLDGVAVKVGEKALRYGQVVTRITAGEINTITLASGSSGDTFTLTVVNSAGTSATTAAIAYDADAAAITAALELLTNVGTGGVVVTGTTPNFTATFASSLGDVTLTGTGTGMTVTTAVTSAGGRTDRYGPYDPAAVDGRAVLANGYTFVVNETVREDEVASDHPPVLEGGKVFLNRIIQSGIATHTLAAGPTLAELLAVMPRLRLVRD